jgi:CRISPR-associated endonuclease Csn1
MKITLGLDLGVTSIGWAVVGENENSEKTILGMGSRIIPLNIDDQNEFTKGNAITKNQSRTTQRTARKLLDRYQLRRKNLIEFLQQNNMSPSTDLIKLSSQEMFGLRSKAVHEKISLQELGRILLHLNQKRGYKSMRGEDNQDKKDTDYVAEVKNRHQLIKSQNLTIGEYFYKEFKQNAQTIVKHKIFPREAYIEEFEAILTEQQKYHPLLNEVTIGKLKDNIIYYQRNLKSQKNLISICEFEGFFTKDANGKEHFVGPRVAPKSSPIFQVTKIWELINSIKIQNKRKEDFIITQEKKNLLFDFLDTNEKLTVTDLCKILGINKNEWIINKQLEKGLQGNIIKTKIESILKSGDSDYSHWLQFNLSISETGKETYLVDKQTGEITDGKQSKIVSPNFESEPFYRLWHTIYSIKDSEECKQALMNKFLLDEQTAEKLSKLDFTRMGFGNKSAKSMRKILPYLMEGYVFSDASSFAGYNHSNAQTKEENLARTLKEQLPNLAKNSLRQPIVEKILNQLINVVNNIIIQYGKPDEIVIELARELKQSKDERNETFSFLAKREKENDKIRTDIESYGLRATRTNVIKYRLYKEINNDEAKLNATCIYCGKAFGFTQALSGHEVDVEHIIPKSILFDDSQSNKTLSHRKCNLDKGNSTAYDYMSTKSEEEFSSYLERVNDLFKRKIIGKGKRDKLLMKAKDIPQDFIERQLNETRYIAKKAKEILEQVCYNVYATGGGVTSYLRNIWGYNEVLMNLQLPKYRDLGLTEMKTVERPDKTKAEIEVIQNWSKRDDHRHHAIDALVIACTRKGFIQRINTLNASETRNEMKKDVDALAIYDNKKSLLENYFYALKPFTTKQIETKASEILISFKPGKRVATISRYKAKGLNNEKGVIIPRGALSEESVYGKIKSTESKPVKYLFENPHLIFKPYIKMLVEERLLLHENNTKAALASLKKDPIFLDEEKSIKLEYGTCFKDEYVIKYSINIDFNKADKIIDKQVKKIIEQRLIQNNKDPKRAFKDLDTNPIWFNEEKQIPIKSVRCFTGATTVEPVLKDENGNNIGFVKPGNNHHIAIYVDREGNKQEHVCTFWHAVERKKFGVDVIIKNASEIWDKILENKENYPQSFLDKLPSDGWVLEQSLQQNEMFILGLEKESTQLAISENNLTLLSNHLYRVQKISESYYTFRHHLETKIHDTASSKLGKRFYRIQSMKSFNDLYPTKVKINMIGQIVLGD